MDENRSGMFLIGVIVVSFLLTLQACDNRADEHKEILVKEGLQQCLVGIRDY